VAEIAGPAEDVGAALRSVPGVTEVAIEGEGEWRRYAIACAKEADPRQDIFQLTVKHNWSLRELRQEAKSLEDVFVALTRTDLALPGE
jgi:ABC-2 type transport system ATP-binding protein